MIQRQKQLDRRSLLAGLGAAGLCAGIGPGRAAATAPLLSRKIPASGEDLPLIGMGTWITFDVGGNITERAQRTEVLQTFFEAGGGMVDSSPMYGSSEAVMGHALGRLRPSKSFFSATKVWTPSVSRGPEQMETSLRLWGLDRFDLLQVHNLVAWEGHLETLLGWKAEGRVRYLGITTSHGRRHAALAKIMAEQPIDFVQFTYNVIDREAEQRLLPLAAERGLAVIINRPFRRGALFDAFGHKPLPDWAAEIDCRNWAQFFLKFVVSHPAVTCAIPATSQVAHMRENMGAARGRLPDPELRQRMLRYVESL